MVRDEGGMILRYIDKNNWYKYGGTTQETNNGGDEKRERAAQEIARVSGLSSSMVKAIEGVMQKVEKAFADEAEKKKPAPAKPNHTSRRSLRLHMRRQGSKAGRANRAITKCGSCGLPFLAPAPGRCQCKVAPPRRAEVV